MTTTTDASTTVDRNFGARNDTDPASHRTAIAGAWSPEGRYADPVADVTGHHAIGEDGRPVDIRGYFGSGEA
jgi:hypothetical protein